MKAISVATEGYWDAEALCIATSGYWCVDLHIQTEKEPIKLSITSEEFKSDISNKDELELLMIIKSFLICRS